MSLTLRERLARLGPVRGVDRVESGSPAVFLIRMSAEYAGPPRTIDAMLTLARRGPSLLRAKRAVEAVLEEGRVMVTLPMVEDVETVKAELAAAGFEARHMEASVVDVRSLRDRLGLTREEFAMRYGLEVETVRNWETGKREPDRTARSYLTAIANDPVRVEQAYAAVPSV